MSMTAMLACRWLRRYKIFFILGLVILLVQFFLAYKSQSLSAVNDDANKLHPQHATGKLSHFHESDDEDSASNSYAKSKAAAATALNGTQSKSFSPLSSLNLNFTPVCDVVTREAISAVHRAKTTACKKQIVDTACAIQEERFYAKHLPNYCPNQGHTMERPMGCYQDEKKFRILSGYYMNFKVNNSPSRCIQMCLQSGFLYAGVQYSTECFCGNDPPKVEAKLPDPSCNLKCPGDAKQTCGGYFTTNVYETGITKFAPQVAEVTTKAGDTSIRIVFLLTLNGRAVRQVHRLLKALYSRDHFYYIHVDSRQDYLYRELKKLEKHAPNIRLATKRFSTIWGGASLLQMLLSSMRDLLTTVQWQWDFVINLSESDFPVKPIEKLVDFLTANRGRNFVKSHGREVQRFIQKQGLDKTFVECDTHMWRIGDRELPNGIQIDGGSDWVALSREFVKYVTSEEKGNELLEGLLVVFRHTLLPAESFFHTALRNSQFCGTYVDNNLHVTNWKRRLGCKCQYKHVVDWCGCSPNDFKPEDWPRLLGTDGKQLFFARKFEPIINQAIILRIEEWLYGPYPNEYPNLSKFWQSIYNHLDFSPKPDAALLTVVNSLVAINGMNNSRTKYSPGTVKEVTTLMDNDDYNGFLIHHSGKFGEELVEVELETWVRPNQQAQVSKVSNIGRRIKVLEVTSEYDQKEQLGRNYGKFLGPNSEPVLVFKVISIQSNKQSSANLTVLWVDPRGILADVSEVYIEDITQTSINFAKQNVRHPLIQGSWNAKLIHKNVLIAQCTYLVIPLNPDKVPKQLKHNLASGSVDWHNFLPSPSDQKILLDKFEATSLLSGDLRDAWIHRLVGKFYVIRESCIVFVREAHADELNIKFPRCDTTEWSSFISDPKSDIITELRHVQPQLL